MRPSVISLLATSFITLWTFLLVHLLTGEREPAVLPSPAVLFQELVARHSDSAEKLAQKLDQPVQLEFIEATLADVVDHLRTAYDLPIAIDQMSLDMADVGPETPITLRLPEIRMRSALTLLAESQHLSWHEANEVVWITAANRLCPATEVGVFAAHRLMEPPFDRSRLDRQKLPDAIATFVAPDTWQEVGGPGAVDHFRDALVVQNDPLVLAEVERLLAALKQADDDYRRDPQSAVEQVYHWNDDTATAMHARMEAALDRPLPEMQFSQTPLDSLLAWMARQTGAPLYLAPHCIAADGSLAADQPFTGTTGHATLRQELTALLRPLGLSYRSRCDLIYIDRDQPGEAPLSLIYPIADLIDPAAPAEDLFWEYFDCEPSLLKLAREAIESVARDQGGRWPEIALLTSIDVMIVSAPRPAQRKLQQMLAGLRAARGPIDYQRHAQQLQAAREGPVTLQYVTFAGGFNLPTVHWPTLRERLLGALPADLRRRVTVTVYEDSLHVRASVSDHHRVQHAMDRAWLPLRCDADEVAMPPAPYSYSVIPVVG